MVQKFKKNYLSKFKNCKAQKIQIIHTCSQFWTNFSCILNPLKQNQSFKKSENFYRDLNPLWKEKDQFNIDDNMLFNWHEFYGFWLHEMIIKIEVDSREWYI